MRQVGLWVAEPSQQPVWVDLASHLGQLGPDVAADQFRLTSPGNGQAVTGGAEHLAETNFALLYEVRLLFPSRHNPWVKLVRRDRCAPKRAQVGCQPLQFLFAQTELGHALLVSGFIAIHGYLARSVYNRARLLQPFVQPLPADLSPDVGEVRPQHYGTLDTLQAVASYAVELH